MPWTTKEAADHYATFNDGRLLNSAADLAGLADSVDPDVVAARPAMDAELEKRGLR